MAVPSQMMIRWIFCIFRTMAEESAQKLFSQEMREITRSIHNKSDTMVNAKLGVTMSDDSVWAEGQPLLYFDMIRIKKRYFYRI